MAQPILEIPLVANFLFIIITTVASRSVLCLYPQRSEERVLLRGVMYIVAVLSSTSMVEPPTMLAVPTGFVVWPGDLAAEERRREGHFCGGQMSAMLKL